ncbi:hypothetical protein SDC9_193222 [bioreactor metagenome]|uniref:Uncharacterized protein n=1 Tax=bioreactor metagenome TaxID=1076179 RepID=A0A645IE16_9ZZZZ
MRHATSFTVCDRRREGEADLPHSIGERGHLYGERRARFANVV